MIRAIRWLVRFEYGIWRSLFLWVFRRRPGTGPGVESFPYAQELTPLLAAFVFGSALEVIVVHLLVPWETLRLVLLVVGLWGLMWMCGFLASVRVFPHLVGPDALVVRNGVHVKVRIPWSAVERVVARRRDVDSNRRLVVDGSTVTVPILQRTRVDVILCQPTVLDLPAGPQEVTEVRLFVDDARAFVAAARQRVPELRTAAAR